MKSTFSDQREHPAIDFVNTVGWRESEELEERLFAPRDLVDWYRFAGFVSEANTSRMADLCADPDAGLEGELEDVLQLREALYGVLRAISHGFKPGQADVAAVNSALETAPERKSVSWLEGRFVWTTADQPAKNRLLAPELLWSIGQLLTDGEYNRIKQCKDDRGCGWILYDMTRNRSRQWCSSESCGNRARARKFYHKQTDAN